MPLNWWRTLSKPSGKQQYQILDMISLSGATQLTVVSSSNHTKTASCAGGRAYSTASQTSTRVPPQLVASSSKSRLLDRMPSAFFSHLELGKTSHLADENGRPWTVSGAQERTRTFTPLPALAPEASASTNSATWARGRMLAMSRGDAGYGPPPRLSMGLRMEYAAQERLRDPEG